MSDVVGPPQFTYKSFVAVILSCDIPRYEPYRQGFQYILEVHHRQALGLPVIERHTPYVIGTTEADAWLSGCDRGDVEWNTWFAPQFAGVGSQQNRGLAHE